MKHWISACVSALVAISLWGCESGGALGGATVTVRVVSDYAPGTQAASAVAELFTEQTLGSAERVGVEEKTLTTSDGLLRGLTIATIEHVAAGPYTLRVALRSPSGALLTQRPVSVRIAEDATFTVHLTVDCAGVQCPTLGAPGNTACFGGECVDPRCTADAREFCPATSLCSVDDDCPSTGTTCSRSRCEQGICLELAIEGECAETEYCAHGVGCAPLDMPVTPGGSDARCGQVCALTTDDDCSYGYYDCSSEDGTPVCTLLAHRPVDAPCETGVCDGNGACGALRDGGADASEDAAGDASAPQLCDQLCTISGQECWYGYYDCTGGAAVCTPLTVKPEGTACSESRTCDVNGHCSTPAPDAGVDAATPSRCGQVCELDGQECVYGVYACDGGSEECVALANKPATVQCSGERMCDGSGHCGAAPSPDASVDAAFVADANADANTDAPDGPVCNQLCTYELECWYGYYDCTGGSPTCAPLVARAAGATCSGGVCDGMGGCGAPPVLDAGIDASADAGIDAGNCGSLCSPSGQECWYGFINCASGSEVCTPLVERPQGVTCTEGTCNGDGDCVPTPDGGTAADGSILIDAGADAYVAVTGDVAQLALGYGHACALVDDGTVHCWGDNAYGQLGYGDTTQRQQAGAAVDLGDGAMAICAGDYHTCALLDDHTVKCWGNNSTGQLGTGDSNTLYAPGTSVTFASPIDVAAISCGSNFTCALLQGGAINCWGENGSGQLGNGTTGGSFLAPGTDIALGGTAIAVAAGYTHTCAIMSDDTMKCWGDNNYGQLGYGDSTSRSAPGDAIDVDGLDVHKLVLGQQHTCAIFEDDTMACWGTDGSGQLGYGGSSTPQLYVGGPVDFGGMSVVNMAAAQATTCAVLANGALKCWGANNNGMLGVGDQTSRTTPSTAVTLRGPAQDIELGYDFACALLASHEVQCWGNNTQGQLGYGQHMALAPFEVPLSDDASRVVVGTTHTCAQLQSGGVTCWGSNGAGEIGIGDYQPRLTPPSATLELGFTPVSMDAFSQSTCFTDSGGRAYCMGNRGFASVGPDALDVTSLFQDDSIAYVRSANALLWGVTTSGQVRSLGVNAQGELGFGDYNTRTVAALVPRGTGGTDAAPINVGAAVVQVGTNLYATCARLSTGAVKCWGSSSPLSGSNSAAPGTAVALGTGRTATDLSLGDSHACALLDSGAVKCWGYNANGQLGNGTTTNSSTPVTPNLGDGRTAVQISSGAAHTCAKLDDGSLLCWGYNSEGQLGNGTTTTATSPITVNVGLNRTVTLVAAGALHTCVVLDDSSLKCWGYNSNGQLGDNSSVRKTSPTVVSGSLSNVASLHAGQGHTCALSTTGELRCWGEGALNGTGTQLTVPPSSALSFGQTVVSAHAMPNGTCVVLANGTRECWGYNHNGRFGAGVSNTNIEFANRVVLSLDDAITASEGRSYTSCVIHGSGTLDCFGYGGTGQLGYGNYSNRPTRSVNFTGAMRMSDIDSISLNGSTSCALTQSGDVYCWGDNYYGQLGYGDELPRPHAEALPLNVGEAATQISVGMTHACAIGASGDVYCWGENGSHQVGDGSGVRRRSPTRVTTLPADATQVRAAAGHVCALLTTGDVYCWGGNTTRECGLDPVLYPAVPGPTEAVPLPAPAIAIDVSAGSSATCAVLNDGRLFCWGSNVYGQVGDGFASVITSPADAVLGGLESEE